MINIQRNLNVDAVDLLDLIILEADGCSADGLAALLQLLEQHSSPESLWRWKIHCKTQKKLKEQARYRLYFSTSPACRILLLLLL